MIEIPAAGKAGKNAHGIGLANIRNTVEKYQGAVDWKVTDRVFTLSVMIKNEERKEEYKQFFTKLMNSIPFASMPGYSANLHTEQFGASIEEHLGQSVPMNSSGSNVSSDSDEEDWWEKRHKKLEEFLEQQEKKTVQRRASEQSRNQQAHSCKRAWLGCFMGFSVVRD